MKRIFDILISLSAIIIISPFLIILSFLILVSSKGPVIFKQIRVGKNNKDFKLYKFRTMYINSESKGQLTVGMRDPRITPIGYFLRKYKLDELPQLLNVLFGDMSLVGPRPEVRKYVELYNDEQKLVLTVKPGITDYASIEYVNENEILGKSSDPERTYIYEIMPEKLRLNLKYIKNQSLITDFKILFLTIKKIFLG